MRQLTTSEGIPVLKGQVLEYCAEAMYKIREPVRSKSVPYAAISDHKKAKNRQVAVEVISKAFQAYSTSTTSDPEVILDLVAADLYTRMAPMKSQAQPLETRTEYAQSWYRSMARNYLFDVLSPYAVDQRRGIEPSARLGSLGAPHSSPELLGAGEQSALPLNSAADHTEFALPSPKPAESMDAQNTNPPTISGDHNRTIVTLLMIVIVLLVLILLVTLIM